jgi:hypothetical protein
VESQLYRLARADWVAHRAALSPAALCATRAGQGAGS